MDLKERNFLISGGTSGINLGIARVLASHGAHVAVFGRDPEKARVAAEEIAEVPGASVTMGLAADVRDPDAVAGVVAEAAETLGPLDGVIAGAAGNFPAPAVSISPKGFKTVVDIDLLGSYNVFWSSFEHLRKPGASLIAITAPQATQVWPHQVHVCAAKAGVNMLVRSLAFEWGPAGVRVNAISPGPIEKTEGMERLAPTPEIAEGFRRKLPLRRFGRADEVGNLAAFLSSADAEYITGCIIPCDGGTDLGDASADCLTPSRR
ncbi:MAG: SDR family oxidoreductase [Pseudomonadota bacterium]